MIPKLNFAFWEFFGEHKILLFYLIIINIIAFIMYGIDKKRAIEGRWRIREKTLLGLAFFGGSIGALIGMYRFRHKTKVYYFMIGVPAFMVMQLFLLFFAMNSSSI